MANTANSCSATYKLSLLLQTHPKIDKSLLTPEHYGKHPPEKQRRRPESALKTEHGEPASLAGYLLEVAKPSLNQIVRQIHPCSWIAKAPF